MLKGQLGAAAAGGALGVLAMVLVYEGHVEVSRDDTRLTLEAGEAAQLDEQGIERVKSVEAASVERASLLGPSAAGGPAAAPQPDEALRRDIQQLSRQLAVIEKEKGALASELARREVELSRRTPGAERDRDEFDLSQEDWRELAAVGSIKYRLPCHSPSGWSPSAEQLDTLGLAPDDASVISEAYERSHARVWGAIRPLCVEAIGNPDVADTLGPNTCTHVVLDMANKADRASAQAAMTEVGLTRAGERPPPEPRVPRHPVFDVFWALTGETQALEADLAQSFGPEEAKRLVYAKAMCASTSHYGGSRRPAP